MRESLFSRVVFSLFLACVACQLFAQSDGWMSVGPAGTDVRSITFDPVNPASLYAATDQGIFRSFDRGFNWTPSNDGLNNPDAYTIVVDPRTLGTVYAGTVNPGVLYKSLDGGATWSRSDAGLSAGAVIHLVIDPANPERIYAGSPSGLFISENGGESWWIVLTSQNASPTIDPTTSAVFVAAYGGRVPNGGFFRSLDHGTTWTEFASLRDIIRPLSISVDPRDPATLLAAGDFNQLATSSDEA